MCNALSFFSCWARWVQNSPSVQEGAEGAGPVDLDFGVLSQLAVGPCSLYQTGHGRSCFADALVDIRVESKGIRDGGSQVDEDMDNT